eukprot:GHVU01045390.1.p1 GENE.GHVU01045390.1~~GHVU01045390.1.p1  ORF type:complete len:123 (+),score=9.44 GHVU01045390.1:1194-1562(+)
MESEIERRVSKVEVQLGSVRLPVVGVLDSGAVNCWISSSAVRKLREAGDRVVVRAIPEGFEADWSPTPEGISEVETRILVHDDIWIEGGPIPFVVVREDFDFVLISERVLEILERLPNPYFD